MLDIQNIKKVCIYLRQKTEKKFLCTLHNQVKSILSNLYIYKHSPCIIYLLFNAIYVLLEIKYTRLSNYFFMSLFMECISFVSECMKY